MRSDARRADEHERVASLRRLALLDTAPEARFDRITALAARLLNVEISMVNLVDADRQWTKSEHGTGLVELPREHSVCTHVVASDDTLLLPDLQDDPRFAGNPYLTGLRFYAGVPLHDVNGLPLGALCVMHSAPRQLNAAELDILESLAGWAQAEINATALAELARTAERSERRVRDILADVPAGLLLLDDHGSVTWANNAAAELFRDVEVVGRPLEDLVPTVDDSALEAHDRRSGDEGGSTRRLVESGHGEGGRRFPVELIIGTPTDAASPTIVVARPLEPGDRDELGRLQQRMDVVFESLREGVLVFEADGRVVFSNLAAAQLLRRRRSDLADLGWHDLIHGNCALPHCPLSDVFALAGRRIAPVITQRSDGTSLPMEISVALVASEGQVSGGSTAGVVVTMDDMTDRLAVDRLKTEFVSSVSHELRTPLTSIRGSLGLLAAGIVEAGTDEGRRMLTIAAESTDRLSRLVNDILDLERMATGQAELDLGRHAVRTLVATAVGSISGAARAAEVTIDVAEGDAWVLGEPDRIVQILVNVLGNAIKFSAPGSSVRVRTEQQDDQVRIAIEDQGRGIPPDQLERIFSRFAQVDSDDARDSVGSGLGLAIARTIAERHNGSLTATSEVGVGSTFLLTLPAAVQVPRVVAYAPADSVPEGVAAALGDRWRVVAADAAALRGTWTDQRPTAVLLAPGPDDEVTEVRRAAEEAHLPLLALARLDVDTVPQLLATVEPAEGASVLVVEDDEHIAEVLATMLSRRGLQVLRAHTQRDAVRQCREHGPDVVVLDIGLAEGDGYGVVEQLRSDDRLACTPVVVYSVLDLGTSDRSRLELGPTAFLTKTYSRVDDVENAVAQLLGRAGTS